MRDSSCTGRVEMAEGLGEVASSSRDIVRSTLSNVSRADVLFTVNPFSLHELLILAQERCELTS